MTYCCGILVRDGLVMVADTRTNAGLDNISTFRKLHVFETPGEKVMLLAAAGNLSVTQTVVSHLREGFIDPETGTTKTLLDTKSMLEAATFVGTATRKVLTNLGTDPQMEQVSLGVTFLFGGQMADRRLRLFMVYTEGNFIEATEDTPYLQIGEHKYGKPVLDRAVSFDTDPLDALKLGLVSMDSTLRSNLSVGLPLDVVLLRRDAMELDVNYRIEEAEPYFANLRESWSIALREAHLKIPRPPYGTKQPDS
ncbi:MAG: peptidase [Hyphomicrobiales bacterium]|nr:peptidase [Hyphomicrobiales bacterium]